MRRTLCALIPIIFLVPIQAVTAPVAHADVISVDSTANVWIYGDRYTQVSGYCFGKRSTRTTQSLQLREQNGNWVTVDTTRKYKLDPECPKKTPYSAIYTFTVNELGKYVQGSEYVLEARESFNDGDKNFFTKTVYSSKQAHVDMLAEAFACAMADGTLPIC
ncbi:MAG: hypothetical protein JW384_00590 [Nitrosomonadaceae bacterium]|nr:hypothetical protein [Nitrosomonadaceae bacterium]